MATLNSVLWRFIHERLNARPRDASSTTSPPPGRAGDRKTEPSGADYFSKIRSFLKKSPAFFEKSASFLKKSQKSAGFEKKIEIFWKKSRFSEKTAIFWKKSRFSEKKQQFSGKNCDFLKKIASFQFPISDSNGATFDTSPFKNADFGQNGTS